MYYTFTKRNDNMKVSIFYEVTNILCFHNQKGEFLTTGMFYGIGDLFDEILYAEILSYFQATNFGINIYVYNCMVFYPM